MKDKYIINSLLDTDYYKLSMLRVYFSRFITLTGRYEFTCRNKDVVFTESMVDSINKELDHLCTLRFTENELAFIKRQKVHKKAESFIQFLRLFQLNRNYITVSLNNGELTISATGPIWNVSYFETFVLSIVNEVYFREKYPNNLQQKGRENLAKDIAIVQDYIEKGNTFKFSDFGTRRRYSGEWQEIVISQLKYNLPKEVFVGTSNMLFAKNLDIESIGTLAHEYLCLGQALPNVSINQSQNYMLEVWLNEFEGELLTTLTDNLTSDYFFKTFPKHLGMLYNFRHDSGCPYNWTRNAIDYYIANDINPNEKGLIYSNGLDFEEAIELNDYFYKTPIKKSFGIGTHLTNNMGVPALNIVMKLVEANESPVCKISDDAGKVLKGVDQKYYKYLMDLINAA